MDPLSIVVIAVAAILGGAVQSVLGFGAAYTLVPTLAVLSPEVLPGAALVAFLPLAMAMAVREWPSMNRRSAQRLTLARIPGIGVGTVAVVLLPVRGLAATVALLLLAAVFATASGYTVRVTPRTEVAAGVVSGFSATTVALGGPPLAVLYRERHSTEIRPTLAVVFSVGIVMSLGSLALAGAFDLHDARVGLLLAACNIGGMVAAAPLLKRLPETLLRSALLWWAGAGALLALVRVFVG